MTALPGLSGESFGTILADPPWRFQNSTGKVAPEHKRLCRYGTMTFDEIRAMPIAEHAADKCHLYLWCPNALLDEGLSVLKAWGFKYKTNLVWYKIRKDGGPDGRGVGFYFRNVTELLTFRCSRKNADAETGPDPGQHFANAEARAFSQAGRNVRYYRGVQPRPIFGAVCERTPKGLDAMGRRNRHLSPHQTVLQGLQRSRRFSQNQRRCWHIVAIAGLTNSDQQHRAHSRVAACDPAPPVFANGWLTRRILLRPVATDSVCLEPIRVRQRSLAIRRSG